MIGPRCRGPGLWADFRRVPLLAGDLFGIVGLNFTASANWLAAKWSRPMGLLEFADRRPRRAPLAAAGIAQIFWGRHSDYGSAGLARWRCPQNAWSAFFCVYCASSAALAKSAPPFVIGRWRLPPSDLFNRRSVLGPCRRKFLSGQRRRCCIAAINGPGRQSRRFIGSLCGGLGKTERQNYSGRHDDSGGIPFFRCAGSSGHGAPFKTVCAGVSDGFTPARFFFLERRRKSGMDSAKLGRRGEQIPRISQH